jgi:hypothetical protein
LPQAKHDINETTLTCQALFSPLRAIFRDETAAPSQISSLERSGSNLLFVALLSTAVFQAKRHYRHEQAFVKRKFLLALIFSFFLWTPHSAE